jgi:hypothetical protein
MVCKVYIWNPERYDYVNRGAGHSYIRITPEELMENYCIWNDMNLWLKSSVPKDRQSEIVVWNPTPYDIWNYECFPFWEGDKQTEEIIRSAYRKRRAFELGQTYESDCEKCLHDDRRIKALYKIYYSEERVKGTGVKLAKYCEECYKGEINSDRIDLIDTVKIV